MAKPVARTEEFAAKAMRRAEVKISLLTAENDLLFNRGRKAEAPE